MDRRNAIVTLSGALVASALAAVPRRSSVAQTALPNSAATPGPYVPPAQYQAQTLDVGAFLKQTSELALVHATHPTVKQFAQFETAEQLTMAQVLTDSANPPSAPLDPQHAALLQQLEVQVGRGFDAAYVQTQIDAHRELFVIQETFLRGVTAELDYQHIAMLARTVIQMHLTMLQDIRNQLNA